jgi:TolA-binding protein
VRHVHAGQALREENSRLRGQVETLTYELDSARKRQQDFYVDLDGRLRKLEPQAAQSAEARTADDGKPSVDPPRKAVSDPAAETREYEAALNLFRANKLKEAAAALSPPPDSPIRRVPLMEARVVFSYRYCGYTRR